MMDYSRGQSKASALMELHSGRGNNNQKIIRIVTNKSSKENRVAFEECHLNKDPSDHGVRKEH